MFLLTQIYEHICIYPKAMLIFKIQSFKVNIESQGQLSTPVVFALRRLSLGYHKFETNLDYLVLKVNNQRTTKTKTE